MHTSSGVDNVDEFAFDVARRGGGAAYRFGKDWRPLGTRPITLRYRAADGSMQQRSITTWRTHRGPIVRAEKGRWVAFAMMDRPVAALQQSFLRTKARDLDGFLSVATLQANSSNNTVFADDKGAVAYLHPQFVPIRSPRFDYRGTVDGSEAASDWGPLHPISQLPNVLSPKTGWIANTNNWPWSSAGASSPRASDFPRYMDTLGENPRGWHAVQLLSGSSGWTLDKLQSAAFDPGQPAFERLIPGLIRAWDEVRSGPVKIRLRDPVQLLRGWDYRWGVDSVPNSVAVFWGEEMWKTHGERSDWDDNASIYNRIDAAPAARKLEALGQAVARLERDFGSWRTPWGAINRFQRISRAIDHPFSDRAPSIPVGFSSARWGSLASFGAAARQGSKRWYGTSGNSFVAVVEFGKRVRARAVTAGGESGNPASPHFNDQAPRYATGSLREVYFYPDQLQGHIERWYRPGE